MCLSRRFDSHQWSSFFGTSLGSPQTSLSLEGAWWEEGWTDPHEGRSVDAPPKQDFGGDAKTKVQRRPPSQKSWSGQPPQLVVGHCRGGPVVYTPGQNGNFGRAPVPTLVPGRLCDCIWRPNGVFDDTRTRVAAGTPPVLVAPLPGPDKCHLDASGRS